MILIPMEHIFKICEKQIECPSTTYLFWDILPCKQVLSSVQKKSAIGI